MVGGGESHVYGSAVRELALLRHGLHQSGDDTSGEKKFLNIHALSPKEQQRHLRYPSETSTFYHNYLTMTNTADVVVSPSPSDRSLSQVKVLLIL
jgi:hypothetical protein